MERYKKKYLLLILLILPVIAIALVTGIVFGPKNTTSAAVAKFQDVDEIKPDLKTTTVTPFILSDTYKEFYPSIAGNKVVFSTRASGDDTNNDIKMYDVDASTTSTISSDANKTECYPDINDNYIVFANKSIASIDSWDIVLYNRQTQTSSTISNRQGLEVMPKIAGNYVIWKEHNPGTDAIYAYNLTTSQTITVRDGSLNSQVFGVPESDGQMVVWVDFRNNNPDIYAFNLSTSTGFAVCTNQAEQYYPDVDGNYIVWEEHRNDYENSDTDHDKGDIYGYYIPTSSEVIVDNQVGVTTIYPRISGLYAVCHASVCSNLMAPARIGLYPMPPSPPLVPCNGSYIDTQISIKGPPQINGNWVVWQDERNASTTAIDIYGYSISGSSEFVLCNQSGDQVLPVIKGNIAVWDDYRNNYDEVACAKLNP